MYFTIETAFAPLKKLFGITYSESLIIFKDKKVTWLLDDKELAKQGEKFVKKVLFDSKNNKKYFEIWSERTKKLISTFNELKASDLSSLKNNEFVKTYSNFAEIYDEWFVLTISLELAASSLEPMLGTKIKSYFKDSKEKDYNKAFSTLTAPKVLTFYRQEQKDLLSILLLQKDKQEAALKNHQQNYYWIFNSYAEAKILTVNYFKNELKKSAQGNWGEVLEEIEQNVSTIKKEKKQIVAKIKPTKEERKLISLVETFSALLDTRKMLNFKSEHFLELFVQEFAKRTKQKASDLKYLLPDELGKSLITIDKRLIKKRKVCFVLSCTDKKIINYTGNVALTIAGNFLEVKKIKQNIIQGTVASTGESHHFRGIARIILTIDTINKVQTGDILVTTMTSPDFVIGMKRAGAIITDTGGMLSHAAIVARELKKPCIVGTEVATKMIHDGDIVELHCGRGTVRVIRHI